MGFPANGDFGCARRRLVEALKNLNAEFVGTRQMHTYVVHGSHNSFRTS